MMQKSKALREQIDAVQATEAEKLQLAILLQIRDVLIQIAVGAKEE